MLKKISLIFLITFISYSCGSNRTLDNRKKITQIEFTNQEFDLNRFKGKWLTNSKYDNSSFAIFQENSHVRYSDKRYVPYKLKKDSIFIYFDKKVAKGRLINLIESEVEILWGTKDPKERIKYFRP
jgi:hypothetical protein